MLPIFFSQPCTGGSCEKCNLINLKTDKVSRTLNFNLYIQDLDLHSVLYMNNHEINSKLNYRSSNFSFVVCREASSPCRKDTFSLSPSSNPQTFQQGIQSLTLCIQDSPQRCPEENGALSPTKGLAIVESEVSVCLGQCRCLCNCQRVHTL